MSNIYYISTRGFIDKATASEAMLKGIAADGGLYVPGEIPKIYQLDKAFFKMGYKEMALEIMRLYFTDFTDLELVECINNAYDNKFENSLIAPLVRKGEAYFLELYHGPTLAFKDMALTVLPYLLKTSTKKLNINKEVVILTATSGDTGKAALEGFADVKGTKIIVFYPKNGVSKIQERQMTTQKGDNTFVIGIEGNFDDAQNGVKEIFTDKEFNKKLHKNNYMFSSANSINIGRLIPQIVYYFYSYGSLLKNKDIGINEKINVVVPTGNFGNILAAFYAKEMGLPINKLICASNENNVLYDFINTGLYDKNRELIMTSSPSMDILVSSNLERLLHYLSGGDSRLIRNLMEDLRKEGKFEIPDDMKNGLKDFYAGYATELEIKESIKRLYDNHNYLIDTHTAVAQSVYEKYQQETQDKTKTVIVSTASPFKFTRSVYNSISSTNIEFDNFELIERLSELASVAVPQSIENLKKKPIIHNSLCHKDEIKEAVERILG